MESTSKKEFIIKSRYPDIELPVGTKTITDILWSRMEKWSGETALICGITKEEFTYKQVMNYGENFSSGLKKLNIEKGSKIGMICPLSPQAVIAFLGVWRAQCTMVPLNPLYTKDELRRKFEILSIDNVITTKEFLPTVRASGIFKNIIVIGHQEGSSVDGITRFEDMIATLGNEVDEPSTTDNKENIALILSSTGTTGDPKNILLSHYSLLTYLRQYFSPDISNTKVLREGTKRNVLITMFPLAHILGTITSVVWPMYQGILTVSIPKLEPQLYHSCFRIYKPTLALLVPQLVKFLIDSPLFETTDFESMTTIICGGAPLPKQHIDDMIKKANRNIIFQECYAATEVCLLSICNPSLNNSKFGSVGRLIPNVVAKVVDLATGKSVGPNHRGEIRVKTPSQANGYYNDDIATAAAFDEDGYYCTGDVGYYDEDECFYIVDRVKDMIKVKSMQVAPKEIESEILKHPKVDNVCVVGVPHERFGEVPRAFIVKKDESLTPDEIHAFIKDTLAEFKQLVGGIEFIDVIPHVGVGKPLRRELRSKYLATMKV